jgi:type IV pilus assembly protein PilO
MDIDNLLASLKLKVIWRADIKYQLVVLLVVFCLIFVVFWFSFGQAQNSLLDNAKSVENDLKGEVLSRLEKVSTYTLLKKRVGELGKEVDFWDKQVTSGANLDVLVADVTSAAVSRGLKIDYVRPQRSVKVGFYSEIPISVRVSGSYHGIGLFVADLAKFPRIVVPGNISLTTAGASRSGYKVLVLDTVVKTFAL